MDSTVKAGSCWLAGQCIENITGNVQYVNIFLIYCRQYSYRHVV